MQTEKRRERETVRCERNTVSKKKKMPSDTNLFYFESLEFFVKKAKIKSRILALMPIKRIGAKSLKFNNLEDLVLFFGGTNGDNQ